MCAFPSIAEAVTSTSVSGTNQRVMRSTMVVNRHRHQGEVRGNNLHQTNAMNIRISAWRDSPAGPLVHTTRTSTVGPRRSGHTARLVGCSWHILPGHSWRGHIIPIGTSPWTGNATMVLWPQ